MVSDRIFIAIVSHKDTCFPNIPFHYPVAVGKMCARGGKGFRDNCGENISEKNHIYNELTAQYWMWKNKLNEYEWFGLCHYRRYFDFKTKCPRHARISGKILKSANFKKYGWDKQSIIGTLEKNHIIVARCERDIPPWMTTIYDNHFDNNKKNSLDMLIGCVKELYPEYIESVNWYFSQKNKHMFNMFIMEKNLFEEYSEWLFSILNLYEQRRLESDLEMSRSAGFMGEHLLNVFCHYKQVNTEVKIRELPIIMFYNTDQEPNVLDVLNANIKHIFTQLFPYNSIRRDYIKWKFFLNK